MNALRVIVVAPPGDPHGSKSARSRARRAAKARDRDAEDILSVRRPCAPLQVRVAARGMWSAKPTPMATSVFRIVLMTSLVLDVLFGGFMLLLPIARLLPSADATTLATLNGASVDSGGLALLSAWCAGLALRWLPRAPAQSVALAGGLGVFMIAMAVLRAAHGGWMSLVFDGLRGAAVLGSIALLGSGCGRRR